MPAYISEIDMEGGTNSNFIEIAVPAGTDTSAYSIAVYDEFGAFLRTYNLGSAVGTQAGKDVYLIDDNDPTFDDIGNDEALALIDDTGNVLQFLSFDQTTVAVGGPADGLTSTPIGVHGGATSSLQSTDGGNTYAVNSTQDPGSIPCYAPGTMIDTPGGPRAVETLRPGDLVLTADHGPQEIRWVRSGDHPLEEVEVDGKPVLIAARALGKGLPAQDLIVSPQHRILVGGGGQLTRYFDTKAFAPAKALTNLPGIRHMKGKTKITWIHFACEGHEVVTANGCLSESLLLGPMVVKGLTRAERRTLTGIFGPVTEPGAALNGSEAYVCLKVSKVRRHIASFAPAKHTAAAKEIRKWDLDAAMERYKAECLSDAVLAD